MKITALKYLILVFIALVIALMGIGKLYLQEKSDRKRLQSNLSGINGKLEYYESKSGKLAARNQVLQFRVKEFEKIHPELSSEIEDLKLKLSRAQSVSQSVIQNKISASVELKDSIVNDTVSAKVFHYQDLHHKIEGIAVADTQHLSIQSIDTLTQVVYMGKRPKPYLWIFSPRQLEQIITSSNPNSTIIYSKHIQITKNRR